MMLIAVVFLCFFFMMHTVQAEEQSTLYWFSLSRTAQMEWLYVGTPGNKWASIPIGIYTVKTGRATSRPTPVPQLTGHAYWRITRTYGTQNPETAQYFLELDVPVSDGPPFGPLSYPECGGNCNWVLPGAFGLHGINGDRSKLSDADPGSSGCIRHKDQDIRALYNLLDPNKGEIRYYVDFDFFSSPVFSVARSGVNRSVGVPSGNSVSSFFPVAMF